MNLTAAASRRPPSPTCARSAGGASAPSIDGRPRKRLHRERGLGLMRTLALEVAPRASTLKYVAQHVAHAGEQQQNAEYDAKRWSGRRTPSSSGTDADRGRLGPRTCAGSSSSSPATYRMMARPHNVDGGVSSLQGVPDDPHRPADRPARVRRPRGPAVRYSHPGDAARGRRACRAARGPRRPPRRHRRPHPRRASRDLRCGTRDPRPVARPAAPGAGKPRRPRCPPAAFVDRIPGAAAEPVEFAFRDGDWLCLGIDSQVPGQ